MAFVIISECLIVSRILAKSWGNKRIYLAVGGANIASGLFGIIASMWMNGGWYLVVWFPWVSSNEVNINNSEARNALIFFYILSFILSLVIETIINILLLRRNYPGKAITKATIIANIVTYIVGSVLLYSYSFGLL